MPDPVCPAKDEETVTVETVVSVVAEQLPEKKIPEPVCPPDEGEIVTVEAGAHTVPLTMEAVTVSVVAEQLPVKEKPLLMKEPLDPPLYPPIVTVEAGAQVVPLTMEQLDWVIVAVDGAHVVPLTIEQLDWVTVAVDGAHVKVVRGNLYTVVVEAAQVDAPSVGTTYTVWVVVVGATVVVESTEKPKHEQALLYATVSEQAVA